MKWHHTHYLEECLLRDPETFTTHWQHMLCDKNANAPIWNPIQDLMNLADEMIDE